MDFSTPIRRVPATTAPLTTLATISTDMTSPITPNVTRNGTQGAIEPVACALTVSQDWAPIRAPARSAAISAGATQAWAVRVIEVARPTTVRGGEPGTPVTLTGDPMATPAPWP